MLTIPWISVQTNISKQYCQTPVGVDVGVDDGVDFVFPCHKKKKNMKKKNKKKNLT